MNVLRTFNSTDEVTHTKIRSIRKCFEATNQGYQIALTSKKLKKVAKNSIRFPSKV